MRNFISVYSGKLHGRCRHVMFLHRPVIYEAASDDHAKSTYFLLKNSLRGNRYELIPRANAQNPLLSSPLDVW